MGGVPIKHHTKSKVGRRRSHQAINPAELKVCPKCGYPTRPHRMCTSCGVYGNRSVKEQKLKIKKKK